MAECNLNDAEQPTAHTIGDNDNDGLWTAYHVAAMSLCFGATQDPAAKASARESMHALYMLQDASGTPGLVARSVVTREEGQQKDAQWRPTPDGKMYWKSDTSSDEIDGHYLAFYTYWEHMAKHDDAERDRCMEQVREVTDYLLDHNYQLIDWTGKRTRWGFWNPENLNDDPEHFLECGLNSLQMLSFLRVAHHITGDEKYLAHYKKLIVEHHYLSNVLLQKKLFPDENNHSDDQLGFVAWYPILQLEQDPTLRAALHAAVRRHYVVVQPERSSFYNFTYATIDPDHADIEAGIQNLCEIPTDRRTWRMENSHRADVVFDMRIDRFATANWPTCCRPTNATSRSGTRTRTSPTAAVTARTKTTAPPGCCPTGWPATTGSFSRSRPLAWIPPVEFCIITVKVVAIGTGRKHNRRRRLSEVTWVGMQSDREDACPGVVCRIVRTAD